MRRVWLFIKKNCFWLVLVGALEIMHLFYLYLLHAPAQDILYAAFLDTALTGITVVCSFFRSRKRIRRLK